MHNSLPRFTVDLRTNLRFLVTIKSHRIRNFPLSPSLCLRNRTLVAQDRDRERLSPGNADQRYQQRVAANFPPSPDRKLEPCSYVKRESLGRIRIPLLTLTKHQCIPRELPRLVRDQSFQATFHTSQTYDNRHFVSFHGVRAAGRNEISGMLGREGKGEQQVVVAGAFFVDLTSVDHHQVFRGFKKGETRSSGTRTTNRSIRGKTSSRPFPCNQFGSCAISAKRG